MLRKALWRMGVRYQVSVKELPGQPDIVFPRSRIIVFCDGDFWHGRDLEARLEKLRRGHNPEYWVSKILRNVARDRRVDRELADLGWTVIRVWEKDILRDPVHEASRIYRRIKAP